MRIESSFEVPVPPETAWDLLMDVPRVIPCMPGATLSETIDESTWKATIDVRLGPISLTFDADVKREAADEEARRASLSASACEARGRGAARATIESELFAVNGGTRVDVTTELVLSGAVAQYGRAGIVEDVSAQLVRSFSDRLRAQLEAPPEEADRAATEEAKPVEAIPIGLAALRTSLARLAGRAARAARERPLVTVGAALGLVALLRHRSRRARRAS